LIGLLAVSYVTRPADRRAAEEAMHLTRLDPVFQRR